MKTIEERAREIWSNAGHVGHPDAIAILLRADREAVEAEFKAKLALTLAEVCEFGEILALFDMGIYPNSAVKKEVCG